MKKCRICGEEKPLDQFHPAKQCRDGRRGECISCFNDLAHNHRAKPNVKEKSKEYHSRQDVRDRQNEARRSDVGKASYWRRANESPSFALSFSLYRALRRCPTENPITHADLMEMFNQQGGRCALTGIIMTWQNGKLSPTSMSMDKIDPALGYARGNVRLICHAINMFRGRMTDDEMFTMALALIDNMNRPKLKLVS